MQDIHICDLAGVKRESRRFRATHLVTLLSSGKDVFRPPRIPPSQHLWLRFGDCNEESTGNSPTPDHVEQLLAFGRGLSGRARVLIHCRAGISRSTAGAFLLLAQHMGIDRAQEAMDRILEARPQAMPNDLIVRYGDEILGASGKLTDIAETVCERRTEQLLTELDEEYKATAQAFEDRFKPGVSDAHLAWDRPGPPRLRGNSKQKSGR